MMRNHNTALQIASIFLRLTKQFRKNLNLTDFYNSHAFHSTVPQNHLKGIVSQDWGRLKMVLLDRSQVRTIPLDVYF
jgi:hypothetical protein